MKKCDYYKITDHFAFYTIEIEEIFKETMLQNKTRNKESKFNN